MEDEGRQAMRRRRRMRKEKGNEAEGQEVFKIRGSSDKAPNKERKFIYLNAPYPPPPPLLPPLGGR